MEFIALHFYILEAISSLVLLILLIALFCSKKKEIKETEVNTENVNRKYKSLQSKHHALHTMLDKIIVEKINMKTQINELSEHSLALEEELTSIKEKYNTILKTLDTNAYKDN